MGYGADTKSVHVIFDLPSDPQIRVCNWKLFFLFLNQNICCEYSKEPSRWDSSFEHPKHMFKLMDKKNNRNFMLKNCLTGPMLSGYRVYYSERLCCLLIYPLDVYRSIHSTWNHHSNWKYKNYHINSVTFLLKWFQNVLSSEMDPVWWTKLWDNMEPTKRESRT